MNEKEQRAAAREFAADWAGRGDEKQETQSFWLALLQKVFGVEEPEKYISFERRVEVDDTRTGRSTTKFIDGYIAQTRVLIEQKGQDIDLSKGYKQSDGSLLSPYQQARRYGGYLPQSEQPRWIVVCNFREFQIHDMNRPNDKPELLELADLEKEYSRLRFLIDTTSEHIKKEMEISLKAGELVGVLYDALLAQYQNPDDPKTLKDLNALCVRLVFCLYAEDAAIFGRPLMFHDYLQAHRAEARRALIDLFRVLDQKPEHRDPYMDDDLAAFPYVNGGLFSDENIVIPRLTDEIIDLILKNASEDFDWSDISPTIFGAVFESTLNPETRRSGGMHYTSIENIHKVIDPLFLDDLRAELDEIKKLTVERTRKARLEDYQKKLAGLTFLDPACGSGNFLTETYLSLRRLENEAIAELHHDQIMMDMDNPIQVSISQFYGIEINDFAATVAKTALWIAESQMMKETEDVVHMTLDFLPLKTNASIVEGNALQIDWADVVPKNRLNYIMGNPPFVGKKDQTASQKQDLLSIYGDNISGIGNVDYVTGWYVKAAEYMSETNIHAAFVSTNSITQGEQPPVLWEKLNTYNVNILFAYRSFVWSSEASLKAHVHCVIIGFCTYLPHGVRYLYSDLQKIEVENINPYLVNAPTTLVKSRSTPICDVPEIITGSQATDDGNFFFTPEEYESFIRQYPETKSLFKKSYNSQGFINGKNQYCLWLCGISPSEYRNVPAIMQRILAVRDFRSHSTKLATRKQAETPALFTEIRQPAGNYIVIPKVSSERRRYIPLGFLSPDVICNNTIKLVPNTCLYHFGVLSSNVHNSWMRAVAGRMKSDYQYSNTIVYNNFPWPTPTPEQKARIEQTAQAILDARSLYPDCSLADLYDEATMPPELRKAHQQNDRAVMQAYGFSVKNMTESSCVAELMKLYQRLVDEQK